MSVLIGGKTAKMMRLNGGTRTYVPCYWGQNNEVFAFWGFHVLCYWGINRAVLRRFTGLLPADNAQCPLLLGVKRLPDKHRFDAYVLCYWG